MLPLKPRTSNLEPDFFDYFRGAIGAAAVHDEDLVETEPRRARERTRQRLLLVQGGNDDGDLHESKELMAYGL